MNSFLHDSTTHRPGALHMLKASCACEYLWENSHHVLLCLVSRYLINVRTSALIVLNCQNIGDTCMHTTILVYSDQLDEYVCGLLFTIGTTGPGCRISIRICPGWHRTQVRTGMQVLKWEYSSIHQLISN